jgi:hypothetical protein
VRYVDWCPHNVNDVIPTGTLASMIRQSGVPKALFRNSLWSPGWTKAVHRGRSDEMVECFLLGAQVLGSVSEFGAIGD